MKNRFPCACVYYIYNNNIYYNNLTDSDSDSDSDSIFYTFLRKVRNAVFSFIFWLGLKYKNPMVIKIDQHIETKHHYSTEL